MKVADGVRETSSQDGAALLDIEQGLCFSLNPVGAKIWELVKRGYSPNQIVDSLEHEFRLPRTQLVSDIFEFVKQLEQMKLIIGGPVSRQAERGFFARLLARNRSA